MTPLAMNFHETPAKILTSKKIFDLAVWVIQNAYGGWQSCPKMISDINFNEFLINFPKIFSKLPLRVRFRIYFPSETLICNHFSLHGSPHKNLQVTSSKAQKMKIDWFRWSPKFSFLLNLSYDFSKICETFKNGHKILRNFLKSTI